MDMLDRLLKHDAWTTRRLLRLCASLDDEQLDRQFPIGLGTLRETFIHIVENVELWTNLMTGCGRIRSETPAQVPIAALTERFDKAAGELFAIARRIADEKQFDDTFVDQLDRPPRHKSYGAGILHLATHGMHHRAQILYMMRRLGIAGVPEGDAMSWENQHVGGWPLA